MTKPKYKSCVLCREPIVKGWKFCEECARVFRAVKSLEQKRTAQYRAVTNARRRERYATDLEYRRKELDTMLMNQATPEGRARSNERNRRYRERNKERLNALGRERYANNPEYRARILANNNRSEAKPENRERKRAHLRERRATDPEFRERSNRQTREGRIRRGHGGGYRQHLPILYKAQKGLCGLCSKKVEWGTRDCAIDHKKPVSKGGDNDILNLWMVCNSCNSRKRDKW